MIPHAVLLAVVLWPAHPLAAPPEADESGFEDDDLDPEFLEEKKVTDESGGSMSLDGASRSDTALWTERFDDQPIAKLRQSLDLDFRLKADFFRLVVQLHGEYDFATLVDRDRFDEPTLEAYETQLNTREAFVAFDLGEFELRVGRLISAWGAGDLLSTLDIVNPKDLREPGTTDMDDLRLPVLATRIVWSKGRHSLEVMAVHENEVGYRPAPSSDFSPLAALLAENELAAAALAGKTLTYNHLEDRFDWDLQSLFFRWRWNGPSIDLSLMGGSYVDRVGVLEKEVDLSGDLVPLNISHPRMALVGHAGSWVVDKFVVRWEVGAQLERPLNVGEPPLFEKDTAHILNTMVGIRWTGVTDLMLSLEVAKPFLLKDVEDLLFDVEALSLAFLASYTTWGERLEFSAAFMMSGLEAEYGWILRGDAGWRLVDGLKLSAGYITYQPGDEFGLLYGLDQHDRLMMSLRWDFQIL